jgi:uncharacterized lipoprotein YmbA
LNAYCPRLVLAWLVSAGVGCASAPVHYYTLTPLPEKSLPAPETSLAIDVRVVHIPPQLNRSELMVRTGPAEVTLLENQRWASPVNDEIKDAVRVELQRRLAMAGLLPTVTKLKLDIDVRHLEAQLGQFALLEASWSATLSGSGQAATRAGTATSTFRADEKINIGYAGIVEGYQREIAELADAVVAVLATRSQIGATSN